MIFLKSILSQIQHEIKKKIEEVKKTLPEGLNLEIAFNRATYILSHINI